MHTQSKKVLLKSRNEEEYFDLKNEIYCKTFFFFFFLTQGFLADTPKTIENRKVSRKKNIHIDFTRIFFIFFLPKVFLADTPKTI